jgi:hypothetical protein
MNWKDVLHYGAAFGLVIAGGIAPLLNTLPGVHIDPTTAVGAGVGILVAGLKGGVTSK